MTKNVVFPTSIIFEELLRLTEEQSVVGRVTVGIQTAGVAIPLGKKLKYTGLCK